jgi:hypothetical protein
MSDDAGQPSDIEKVTDLEIGSSVRLPTPRSIVVLMVKLSVNVK